MVGDYGYRLDQRRSTNRSYDVNNRADGEPDGTTVRFFL
jgi:hypothetical protein